MSVKAHYVGKTSYAGLPSSEYSIDFGDFKVVDSKSSIRKLIDSYSFI